MTYPTAPPDGLEVVIKWLIPLGVEVRDERPAGAELPYRMVTMLPGPDDRISQDCLYSVHSFAESRSEAKQQADLAHNRMLYLAGRFTSQQSVTLEDGREVQADDVAVIEPPHEKPWIPGGNVRTDNSMSESPTQQIFRFVGTYQVKLRYLAVT